MTCSRAAATAPCRESASMNAGVVTARPMVLVAATLFVAWGLALNLPSADANGIHLLLIAVIAVALAALTLGALRSAAVAPAFDSGQVAPPGGTSYS